MQEGKMVIEEALQIFKKEGKQNTSRKSKTYTTGLLQWLSR